MAVKAGSFGVNDRATGSYSKDKSGDHPIPLTLWLVVSIITHSGNDYTAFIAWLKMPLATCMMILLLIALFYHAALGLQVIIEDYVHSAMKIPALVLMRLACFGLVVTGILAVLRIVFSH